MKKILIVLIFSVWISSCATSRKTGWEDSGAGVQLTEAQKKSEWNAALEAWKKRDDKASLETALAKFEHLALADRNNIEALVYLARGNHLLADAHYEDMESKIKYWEMGAKWGERGMATNAAFKKFVVDEQKDLEEGLSLLTKRESPAVYWAAASLGKWAKASGLTTILKYKSRVKKMIETVEKLTPDYFYGAVERYWGVYYAVAPGFAGGSMEKSEEHFKKAFAMSKDYLATHVLYAENYATKKGDKDLFKKELALVLSADLKKLPELQPEHVIEKKKAQKLLDQTDELF